MSVNGIAHRASEHRFARNSVVSAGARLWFSVGRYRHRHYPKTLVAFLCVATSLPLRCLTAGFTGLADYCLLKHFQRLLLLHHVVMPVVVPGLDSGQPM